MSDHLQRHAEDRRLDAIRTEAERLLALDGLAPPVRQGLELIAVMAGADRHPLADRQTARPPDADAALPAAEDATPAQLAALAIRMLRLDALGLAAVLHMRRAEAEETLANPLELTGLQRVALARALERMASDSDGVTASRLRAIARRLAETSDSEEPRRGVPRGT